MTAAALVLLPLIRLGLFFGCRLTLLPWLFGEAKHAALDSPSAAGDMPLTALPTPVTTTSQSSAKSKYATTSAAPALLSLSPSAFAALLLSLSFEEGAILFILVLLQAMNFEVSALVTNWRWSLFGVVALAVCFIRE